MTKTRIIERLESTPKDSPIAIFLKYPGGSYMQRDVSFANTVKVQQMIKNRKGDLVGIFDKTNIKQFMEMCP